MSIEKELKQEKIKHLDLREYTAVESGTTVQAVVDRMRRDRHNCALILKDNRLIGIFTERDVLNKVAMESDTWKKPIDEFMTPAPGTIDPDDTAENALQRMADGHFRNVPVVDSEGNIQGNVTHYAFIKFLADHFPQEIYNLPPDEGIHKNRYGG
ncbi:MAG TPA: CBS domain-containing protein [Aggregatilineales bacterium]|nr:CBS domain-containing protein [Aggregatilineales bacterium]